MIRAAALMALLAAPVQASDASDMVAAISGICLTSLETGAAVGPGLTRAGPEMETKLLNGKIGKIWRTWNDRIVIVAHASGRTCEVMGINIAASDFGTALRSWAADGGQAFTIAEGENLSDAGPGGAYLATQLADGDFVQIYVQSHTDARFIGATVGRVDESEQARDVLGLN